MIPSIFGDADASVISTLQSPIHLYACVTVPILTSKSGPRLYTYLDVMSRCPHLLERKHKRYEHDGDTESGADDGRQLRAGVPRCVGIRELEETSGREYEGEYRR